MKIVDDSLEVLEGTKPRKYKVIEGKKTDTTNEVMKFVSKRNRVKKKAAASIEYEDNLFHQFNPISNS